MIGAAVGDVLHLQMQEFCDLAQLFVGHAGEGRHAFFGAAFLQERNQMLAMIVAQHDIGSDEIGPLPAPRLRPVAEGAALLEQRRTLGGGILVGHHAQPQKRMRRLFALGGRRHWRRRCRGAGASCAAAAVTASARPAASMRRGPANCRTQRFPRLSDARLFAARSMTKLPLGRCLRAAEGIHQNRHADCPG